MSSLYSKNTSALSQNFYHMISDRPQLLDTRKLEQAKVIFIGHNENKSDHVAAIAELLNTMATKDDLLLIEYLDRGSIVSIEKHGIRVLDLLKYYGLRKPGLMIKGWDETRLGPEIALMLSHLKKLDFNILITRRNDSLAKAVRDDLRKYNKIFVVAGTLHFCVPPDFPIFKKRFLLSLKLHIPLYKALKKEDPLVIVPINKNGSWDNQDLSFDDHGPRRKLNSCDLFKVTLVVAALFICTLLLNRSTAS